MKLKELLFGILSESELQLVVRAYDLVGDIVILTIPGGLEKKEQEIASAILANNHKVKVVAKRAAHYGGEFRSRPIKIIGGEVRSETEAKEFGVRLQLDVETVYFSARSGNERKRIASLVQPEENVLVLFSGIAPYPLMISKYSRAATITGIEINEFAHSYAVKNLRLNKVGNISLIHNDVIRAVDDMGEKYDRIIMPLPTNSEAYLECALRALVPDGTIHFYDFKCSCNFETAATLISSQAELLGRKVVSSKIVVCGHISPQSYRICVDAVIE